MKPKVASVIVNPLPGNTLPPHYRLYTTTVPLFLGEKFVISLSLLLALDNLKTSSVLYLYT